MQTETAIQHLLDNAGPAIRYRLRRDIMAESPDTTNMASLRNQILRDRRIRHLKSWQHRDGYLGDVFHAGMRDRLDQEPGTRGAEGAIRFLSEMGLDIRSRLLGRAVKALCRDDWFRDRMGVCWTYYPQLGMYGLDAVRAATLAWVGMEHRQLVRPHVESALLTLTGVMQFASMREITEKFRDRLVFRPGVVFPETYHLVLLGRSQSWRTPENLNAAASAVGRLVDLSPFPVVKVRYKSRWLGPAAIHPANLKHSLHDLNEKQWAQWFWTFELFARMGVVPHVAALSRQADELSEILADGEGLFTRRVSRTARDWNAYGGLALEENWNEQSRACDMTFRCLLILHHCGRLAGPNNK